MDEEISWREDNVPIFVEADTKMEFPWEGKYEEKNREIFRHENATEWGNGGKKARERLALKGEGWSLEQDRREVSRSIFSRTQRESVRVQSRGTAKRRKILEPDSMGKESNGGKRVGG